MDEEGGEEEMEWLMEELEAPPTSAGSSAGGKRGRSQQSNGHITTKPVNTDGLRSFSLDEDSEDEVLSVPGVRVLKSSGGHSRAQRSALLQVSIILCLGVNQSINCDSARRSITTEGVSKLFEPETLQGITGVPTPTCQLAEFNVDHVCGNSFLFDLIVTLRLACPGNRCAKIFCLFMRVETSSSCSNFEK